MTAPEPSFIPRGARILRLPMRWRRISGWCTRARWDRARRGWHWKTSSSLGHSSNVNWQSLLLRRHTPCHGGVDHAQPLPHRFRYVRRADIGKAGAMTSFAAGWGPNVPELGTVVPGLGRFSAPSRVLPDPAKWFADYYQFKNRYTIAIGLTGSLLSNAGGRSAAATWCDCCPVL